MSGEVIKEFLVAVGFDVDDSSFAKFGKAISDATVKVTGLFAAVQGMAAGVFYGIAKVSEGFEEMGYAFRIISPAINKAIVLRQELLKAYSAAGVNITQAVVGAVRFNMALTKTQYAIKAIYSSVAVKFFPLLTKQMDTFRNTLYKNLPKIEAVLGKFISFLFKAFDWTTQLGMRAWSILSRLYDFFVKLHDATNGWSTVILGVVAAWKLLNLSFLATPLGMLLAGLVGILALFDDFKTWQEGGESLFDWSSFVPVINAVEDALSSVWDVLKDIFATLGQVAQAIMRAFHGDFSGALDSLKQAGLSLLQIFGDLGSLIGSIFQSAGQLTHWIAGAGDWDITKKLMGNTATNAQSISQPQPGGMNPLGTSSVSTANTNQNVSQQTNINVMGTADAHGTAAAVTSQQYNVNRDLVRNLKGATTPAGVAQ